MMGEFACCLSYVALFGAMHLYQLPMCVLPVFYAFGLCATEMDALLFCISGPPIPPLPRSVLSLSHNNALRLHQQEEKEQADSTRAAAEDEADEYTAITLASPTGNSLRARAMDQQQQQLRPLATEVTDEWKEPVAVSTAALQRRQWQPLRGPPREAKAQVADPDDDYDDPDNPPADVRIERLTDE